ncbi:MAG: hypothetical protein U1G07_21275 [Verrucomicrobiota bacterium]
MAALALGWACLAGPLAPAGTFTSDFGSDPGGAVLGDKTRVEGGYLKLQDLQDYIDGTSSLPMHGSYVFPLIDAGQKVASFNAKFHVSIHGGTEQPAQGFSFVLADDIAGFTSPFREGGATGDGTGFSTGLIISFDTVDNAGVFSANGNDPGDAPGIIVRIGGQRVAAKKFANLRTGPANDQKPVFVPVEINLDADGTLDVTYNGVKVYDNFGIPYAPIAGNFGVGAGTAELTAAIRANHWFDDMTITTTTVSAGAVLLSAAPLGSAVRPDAPIRVQVENLGNAAGQLEVDGQKVTSQSSTTGSTTTITYTPAIAFAPNSTHTVKFTYGAQSTSWSFTVLNATVIPAGFAAAPNTVDTTKPGFSVRVHQLADAPAAGNTIQRAEDQLAGNLGANIADLSQAVGGVFTRNVINMEGTGAAEGGVFNTTEGHPDELIPGIPGSGGTSDNIAMEVTGYLDLKKGVYTLGLVTDDNARLTIGPDPRDATAARLIDVAVTTGTTTILVDADGLYPLRVLWTQGTGGVHLELWSVQADGTRVLLNDTAVSGAIKAYAQAKAGVQRPPYVSSAKPLPGDANVSVTPKIELAITEESTTVTPASIKLSINGLPVTLAGDAISKSGKVTSVKHQVAEPLASLADQTLRLEFSDSAGTAVTREWKFTTGKASAGNLANAVKGQWDFQNGNLAATIGRDLHYIDAGLASRYQFGLASSFGIPLLGGKDVKVLRVPYMANDETDAKGPIFKRIGLRLDHNIAPNGGGTKVNQYTLIMDVLWGPEGTGFGSLLQTHDLDNPTDGDLFWRASDGYYGKGCCSLYDVVAGVSGPGQARSQWARVVFSVDLASSPRKLAKFIDGKKHREDLTGDGNALDSRFGLPPEVFLFGDGDDNERAEAFVRSIQIREGALTDEEVAALGAASPDGIPIPYSQWDFDAGTLAASPGADLQYIDSSLASRFEFGTTTQFGIPDIDGKPAKVIHIPYMPNDETDAKGPIFKRIGLRMDHGLGANGGGQKLNQYTLIMDVFWGAQGTGFGSLLQTHDLDNPTDGDMFWRASDGYYGKGCCSLYDGVAGVSGPGQAREQWARVVFSVDLASTPRKFAKFINGKKHREDLTGDGNALDSRFGLPPEVFLFGDGDDNERAEAYVNSIQIRAGAMTDEEVAALGSATSAGIPSPNPVKGQWEFDDGLAALVGQDLGYIDGQLAGRYAVGTTTQFGIPGIGGKEATVLHIPYMPNDETDAAGAIFKRIGLRVNHGIAPNGGGTKVNQWTLVLDVFWGTEGTGFGSLLQTHDLTNPTDGDLFWRASDGYYGKGCCSLYDVVAGVSGPGQAREQWARVVFSVDLASTPRKLAKFINGQKHREDLTGDGNALDSRFALPPEVFMFGDGDDNERAEAYVSAIQFRDGAMTDEEVAALGGPSPYGIPGASSGGGGSSPVPVVTSPTLIVTIANGSVTISWQASATFSLESKDALGDAAWTPVTGVANNSITLQPAATSRFFRLRK